MTEPYYYTGYAGQEKKRKYWDEALGEIHFKNENQVEIWVRVLGQVSDGYWGNRIRDWMFWYQLKPIVDGTLGWKRYDDVVPIRDEWPIDYCDIEDNLRGDEWEKVPEEKFQEDLRDVSESVSTSLRRIGYLS